MRSLLRPALALAAGLAAAGAFAFDAPRPADRNAFSHPTPGLAGEDRLNFALGNALFRKIWVPAPSSTQASDGLGPLFNARACDACHRRDGRGTLAADGAPTPSLLFRLADAEGRPDPVYGRQLQPFAVAGLAGEGRVITRFETPTVPVAGGSVSLRRPVYRLDGLPDGPLSGSTRLSPRLTPAMIGLGLIEAIPAETIVARADPDDRDGDGISGRAAIVTDLASGKPALGRFGWKATRATLKDQVADAMSHDLGLSSPLFPAGYGDCTARQAACRALPDGGQARLGGLEAPAEVLDLVTFYAAHLAVPPRRNTDDPTVRRGERLFAAFGCASCHHPDVVTAADFPDKALAFRAISPYSDFLLHDMGDALADGQAAGDASGREWRTPPLWGIGLTATVTGATHFLHDGRARSLAEAILWHGGEAEPARAAFAAAAPDDRQALIAFLESL